VVTAGKVFVACCLGAAQFILGEILNEKAERQAR
jgi:hypothetical protein